MESASAPGTVDRTSVHDLDEDWPPVLADDHGGVGDTGTHSGKPSDLLLETEDLYADDVVGVSISRVQTQMRSPVTPAAEKARVLNLPLDYFQRILTLDEEANESDDQPPSQPETPTLDVKASLRFENENQKSPSPTHQPTDEPPLPSSQDFLVRDEHVEESIEKGERRQFPSFVQPSVSKSQNQHDAKESSLLPLPSRTSTSMAKALANIAGQGGRQRSSSGPSALFSNLRKFLPDLPSPSFNMSSISLLPSSSKSTGHPSQENPVRAPHAVLEGSSLRWPSRDPLERRKANQSVPDVQGGWTTFQRHLSTVMPSYGLDGSVESLLSPVSPASNKSRARSNSESSLYLRRKISGVSAYDDTSAFANVTDMTNSRFKAITDSFQNSTLRLTRLPIIRPSPKRRVSPEQFSTETIRGFDVAVPAPPRQPQDQLHSSMEKMRNVKRAVEVETPQQRAHPILANGLSKTTGDLVILGGYRGSVLRSAQPPHRQLWVPVKVGLNLRKVDLEVGLTREDEERMEETIIPSGILSHIGPIDICRRLLKHMRKCPNTRDNKLRVHDWGYDWRLSPDLSSARLIKFLESLECNHPETPAERRGATVVAHSLGGLVTRHAVNQRPDLFAGVVYAGVPQHCVNILGPLRNGDDVLLSSRVLTAQVNFTLRTSFVLLPEDGRCFIQKDTNKRYDLNFFDPRVWEEQRLSPCINPPLPSSLRDGDRRKSIIGALSESINLSSNRLNPWFGGQASQTAEPKQVVEDAGQHVAERAAEAGQALEGGSDEVVGPTMKQPHHRPSVATTSTIPKDLAEEYLRRTLAEVLAFKQQLRFNASHQEKNMYPPHAYLFGKTVPTVYGARVANEEAIKYSDVFDDLVFAAGDGVVLASAAQLPEGYRCVKGGRVESDRGHVGLLGDLEGVGQCLAAVADARAKGVGMGYDFLRSGSQ